MRPFFYLHSPEQETCNPKQLSQQLSVNKFHTQSVVGFACLFHVCLLLVVVKPPRNNSPFFLKTPAPVPKKTVRQKSVMTREKSLDLPDRHRQEARRRLMAAKRAASFRQNSASERADSIEIYIPEAQTRLWEDRVRGQCVTLLSHSNYFQTSLFLDCYSLYSSFIHLLSDLDSHPQCPSPTPLVCRMCQTSCPIARVSVSRNVCLTWVGWVSRWFAGHHDTQPTRASSNVLNGCVCSSSAFAKCHLKSAALKNLPATRPLS